MGGIYYRVQVSHMKLCASRAFWLVAYPSQGHEMLFDAHTRSFAALGGVARRGIYDNMKTAVDKVKKGKGRIVNERFATMCAHYLVDPDFCNVASGWEKGPFVVSCGTQQSELLVVVEPGGHVGRLHLSLSTCPRGSSRESGFEHWSGSAVHQRIGSAAAVGG